MPTFLAIESAEEPMEEGEAVPVWRSDILAYLGNGSFLIDPKMVSPLLRRTKHFLMVDGVLFKKSYGRPLLRCLGLEEVTEVLKEIHEGCCGNHLGG